MRKAASYSSSLKKQQLSLVDRIEREALGGGEELEIRYQFTVAVNGIATVVPYGRIEQILAVDGVADVYLEERYELDATVQPDTATAGEMVGSYSAWADGYTGAGSRIAIIDTGLDLSHPSFFGGRLLLQPGHQRGELRQEDLRLQPSDEGRDQKGAAQPEHFRGQEPAQGGRPVPQCQGPLCL